MTGTLILQPPLLSGLGEVIAALHLRLERVRERPADSLPRHVNLDASVARPNLAVEVRADGAGGEQLAMDAARDVEVSVRPPGVKLHLEHLRVGVVSDRSDH